MSLKLVTNSFISVMLFWTPVCLSVKANAMIYPRTKAFTDWSQLKYSRISVQCPILNSLRGIMSFTDANKRDHPKTSNVLSCNASCLASKRCIYTKELGEAFRDLIKLFRESNFDKSCMQARRKHDPLRVAFDPLLGLRWVSPVRLYSTFGLRRLGDELQPLCAFFFWGWEELCENVFSFFYDNSVLDIHR